MISFLHLLFRLFHHVKSPLTEHSRTSITGYHIGYKKFQEADRTNTAFKTLQVDSASGQHYSQDITGLEKLTKYTVVVQAFNNKGSGPFSDEVIVQTTEFDPPTPPILKVISVTFDSIELEWDPINDGNPVFGYIIKYKKQDEYSWHKQEVSGDVHSHTLVTLDCGSSYHMTITGRNSMGTGRQSETISVKTHGSLPRAPKKEVFISPNSTFLILYLASWMDNDCPIDYFSIQYKSRHTDTWTKLDEGSFVGEKTVFVRNLHTATWYNVWVSARNSAGTTDAEYKIATLTENGGESFRPAKVAVIN